MLEKYDIVRHIQKKLWKLILKKQPETLKHNEFWTFENEEKHSNS